MKRDKLQLGAHPVTMERLWHEVEMPAIPANVLRRAGRPVMLGGVGYRARTRWVATIAGLAFIAGGIALGSGPYRDRRAFEKAEYCAAVIAQDDCITRVRMTVVSRSTYTTHDSDPNPDPNWPPPQPPPQPPMPGPFRMAPAAMTRILAALPMSETTHYKVKVRTADGRLRTFETNGGIYDVAKPGATGLAEVWHGRIARLRIGAHSDDEWSYWSLGAAWLMAWIGVMLVVGRGLPLADLPPGAVFGGWWVGVVLFAMAHAWRPALWAVPLLVAGSILSLRASATVKANVRRRGR